MLAEVYFNNLSVFVSAPSTDLYNSSFRLLYHKQFHQYWNIVASLVDDDSAFCQYINIF
jgi:hypothetical protein